MSDSISSQTIHDLRSRWKPTKERLQRASAEHPLAIRMHRAFSWLAAVDNLSAEDQLDEKLIFCWIALNSLYGRWNDERQEPESDKQTLNFFLTVVRDMDCENLLENCLAEHQPLVISICSDRFVNEFFWRTLNTDKRFSSQRDKFSIERLYAEKKWLSILDELIGRIYLVRCQLVHGASTFGGKLNRDAVRRCGMMLEQLMFCILTIISDHGYTENWDNLCYPPVRANNEQNGLPLPNRPR